MFFKNKKNILANNKEYGANFISRKVLTEEKNLLLGVVAHRFNIYADRSFINQFSTQHTSHCNQKPGEQREIKSPGPDQRIGIINSKQPIERREREQHHRKSGVTPSGNQTTNARHGDQIYQTNGAGNPAAQRAYASEPETGARPKIITTEQVSAIGGHQTNQRGDRKVNQHRVDRVTADRHLTNDGFMHGGHLSVVFLLTLFLAGCSGPLSSLDPAGPSARSGALLWWGMFAYASVVFVAVVALWLHAMRRPPDTRDEAQQRRIHNRWIIGGGVILPSVSITLLLLFGIPTGHRMLPLPPAEGAALRIDVIGHQWWWEVRYPDSTISLNNELHIPAGTPIDIHLSTADVIHGFWVPRLGGKLDAIPGRINVLRLQADEPGVYLGQCAEFCGLHHAVMKFTVTAHSPEEFNQWIERQQHERGGNAADRKGAEIQ
jgi:cytochrome c oxidase subunit 2